MDPNFSVLLGDEPRDSCDTEQNGGKEKNRINGALIGGLVGGIVGLILLSAFAVFFVYPRVNLWRKTKNAEKLASFASVNSGSGDEEMMQIEKRADMQVNTSAGNFTVRY